MSSVSPASLVTGCWLAMLGLHQPLVNVLSGELGDKLGMHLTRLALHAMEFQVEGVINEKAVANAEKAHKRVDAFGKYINEAEYVLDAFALVAAAAGAPSAETGNAIAALAWKHGMTVRESDTLEERAYRACTTLAHSNKGRKLTEAPDVSNMLGILESNGMRRALRITVKPHIFADQCANLITKVKDTSRGCKAKPVLDAVAATLKASA